MATLTLAQLRTALLLDLKAVAAVEFTTTQLERAITRAVADMNRMASKQAVYEVLLDLTVANESWTSGGAHGTYVSFANKPIKVESETVTSASGAVTYTRDTDYRIDYFAGRMTTISGGAMATGTAYLVDYTKSEVHIDLSSLNLIRVDRVEYRAGQVPSETVEWSVSGKIMTVTSGAQQFDQQVMSDGERLWITYSTEWTDPVEGTGGDYPEMFDEVLLRGSQAYALYMKSRELLYGSATDLTSAAAQLALVGFTAVDTAITAANASLTLAAAALAKLTSNAEIFTNAITAIAAARTAAVDAVTLVLTAGTYLTGASESTKALLAQILTDVASLRTALNTALTAAATALSSAATDLTSASGVWADEVKYLETTAGKPNAEDYLEAGDDKIDTVNIGDGVAIAYKDYANSSIQIALSWADKRKDFISASEKRIGAAVAYIQEAAQRLDNLRGYISQASTYSLISDGIIKQAQVSVSAAQVQLSSATERISMADRWIGEAREQINSANVSVAVAQTQLQKNTHYETVAERYGQNSQIRTALATKFREDADNMRAEFWSILRDRKQYIGDLVMGLTKQQVA